MWILFALLAAFSAAVVTVLSKAGIKNLDPSLAFAVQAIMIVIVAWAVIVFQGNAGELKKVDSKTWIYLITAGVITTASSLLTFRALKLGDASRVNPLERLSLVFAIVMAGFFLKEKITLQIIIGAVLMAAGAIVIAMAKKA
jgi:transporter family protein